MEQRTAQQTSTNLGEPLLEIGRRYGCDKVTVHHYAAAYERYFGTLRQQPVKILEIGIGGEDRLHEGGASLKTWHDYFPNAEIYGIDIYDKSELNGPRLHTFVHDQSDQVALQGFAEEHGPFDIVIDDGSHMIEHVLASFFILYNHVTVGGYYVIEDLQTSYWANYNGTSLAPDVPQTPINWLKRMVDILNAGEFTTPNPLAVKTGFALSAIHFHHNIAFVEKAAAPTASDILNDEHLTNIAAVDRQKFGDLAEVSQKFQESEAYRRKLFTLAALLNI